MFTAPETDDNNAAGQRNEAPGVNQGKFISSLTDIPAVGQYLKRVGAKPRSMTTAVVREQEGRYWRDRATIRLNKANGEINIEAPNGDSSAFEPTALEAAAIAAQIADTRWPELQPLQAIINPPKPIRDASRENIFEFRNRDGTLRMIQVRIETDSGKIYIPWTYWTDGQWRQCEPDGLLIPFGLNQLKDHNTVFLHEGAKAARAVVEMLQGVEGAPTHPWAPYLAHAAHLGWIGGALSPHRTDWSVLAQAGVQTVFIVADNDPEGHSAVPKISKLLSSWPITVMAIRFDDRFPIGFDLADSMPAEMFAISPDGRATYSGPTLLDCRSPATWGTRVGSSPPSRGRGRTSSAPIFLRQEFQQQWSMVAGEGSAIFVNHFDRSRLYSEDGFNTAVRPFSDSAKTSELFKSMAYAQHVKAIAYEPGDEQGIITVEGDRSINTWVPSRISPTEGDCQPWLAFMTHLFPEPESRAHVMKWCATLIARPRVRMKYGLLFASTTQGVGKTTLCEIMRVLLGEKNCRSPSARDVVDSPFNSWIVRKRLVSVNEIYEGGKWNAYQKLKSFITDLTLEANEKMIRAYSVRNWAHFILCSNAEVPLWIEDEDRRFFVPEMAEVKAPRAFWTEFYGWLDGGGYAIIAHWAERYIQKHGAVGPGDEAPESARKRALIEDSRSAEELLARSIADAAKARMGTERPTQVVLVESEIVEFLAISTGRTLKPNIVRGWLRKAGLYISKERIKVHGKRTYVAGTLPILDDETWPMLEPYWTRPTDLGSI